MERIDHIGIAVKDLKKANLFYKKLLGTAHYKIEFVESEHVNTSFFKMGENKIELLEATSDDSPIAKFIAKYGEGMHHVAYAVDDIKGELKRLKEEGFDLINETPKRGADNKWVAFVHPKSAGGILMELCQDVLTPDLPERD
ncbi:methylmalonyl-CoA epimerase [Flavimarina sp. Hel_I_48]|uniref:methylmalonyl-CoA epimerase n=1 Tax=Flavimarina sp. Hel_I_48 TaxID=1392488 RepID=UPI0004DF8F93|nr:methylmalonyl-CoA epimerase [Flavimarina sp. Hel_I_48]